jgi:beta-mannosidase
MLNLTALHITPPEQVVMDIHDGFEYFSTLPGQLDDDRAASVHGVEFLPVHVPGALAANIEEFSLQSELDNQDHWYRTTFSRPSQLCNRYLLRFDGLLTLAEVYVNGHLLLQSSSAYHVHEIDVTEHLVEHNQLWICFRAIRPIYRAKHPRAAYMTRLINERHLRFLRTPVLGYTPGFSSSAKPVGPYRPIRLLGIPRLHVTSSKVDTRLVEQSQGVVSLDMLVDVFGTLPQSAKLVLTDSSAQVLAEADIDVMPNGSHELRLQTALTATVEAYWPHTHGNPVRYSLEVKCDTGDVISLGQYGFRRIQQSAGERFMLEVNGAFIFLRGACWTPVDSERLYVDADSLRQRLMMLRDAGFNLLRIPGNMLYESDNFYELCDEFGILVFQDFAFTNFDYPETDEFLSSVRQEILQFLSKHGWRPCLAALCGGSEVAQQAAMMGVAVEKLNQSLFTTFLPELVREYAPHIPYVVSSPHSTQGMPFHVGDGPTTYFGVGGYLRSFEDARLFKGRFITECLPFSHVPEEESLREFWQGEIPPSHHPLWKDGVTRDPGSGWDFSDITDFYLKSLFDVDPIRIRSISPEKYRAFCRATVVVLVETVMSIFRADSAQGRAALVWLLHDFKPGAGWGYIDTLGRPKSSFYGLSRVFQPVTVVFVDEGLDGLAIYAANDRDQALSAQLKVGLVTDQGDVFEETIHAIDLKSRSVQRFSIDTLMGHFVDSSYAYRFGPRAFVSCVASLYSDKGKLLARKVHVPATETHVVISDADWSVDAMRLDAHTYQLKISSTVPAYFAALEVPGFALSDNYFHVLPGFEQYVQATSQTASQEIYGRVRALNMKKTAAIKSA